MPPAARVGDKTTHAATPLGTTGPGSPNVLIGGRPAWRAQVDKHDCPLSDPGPVAHVGGFVMSGSSTVLINNQQAARQGDAVVEATGSNPIAEGCPTVIIG